MILVKSQSLTKHSPFQREMERIQIPIFIRVCRLMCRLTVFLLYKIIEFSQKKKKKSVACELWDHGGVNIDGRKIK